MKFSTIFLSSLAAVSVSALSAAEIVQWGSGVVSSQANKGGEMRTMDSWSYVNCGAATDLVQLKSLKVSPDPPVPGETLTVTVEADVLKTIEEGAFADVTVKLGLIKLLQKQFDVCEEARTANATVQCPVETGLYTVSQSVDLPKEIPHAKFQVSVRGYSVDEEDMLCLDIFVDFMKGRKPFSA